MNRLRILAIVACVGAFALAPAKSYAADGHVWEAALRVANAVSDWLEQENMELQVKVGAFMDSDGAANAEFTRLLEEACMKAEKPIEVKRSEIVISGRLRKAKPREESQRLTLAVEVVVEDLEGVKKETMNINVGGDEAIHLLSPTVEFSPDETEQKRDEKLDLQLSSKSKAFIENDMTLGADQGEFGVEVRTVAKPGAESVPVRPADVDGQSFVRLAKQQEYIVRLHNRSTKESAVALTIDGLSMFVFATDGSQDSLVILPPESQVDVLGWYVDSNNTDAFEITEYCESAAAAQKLPQGNIGVITARFHESLPATGKGAEATKRGRRIEQKYEQVQRSLGSVRAYVTVRYNRDGK